MYGHIYTQIFIHIYLRNNKYAISIKTKKYIYYTDINTNNELLLKELLLSNTIIICSVN